MRYFLQIIFEAEKCPSIKVMEVEQTWIKLDHFQIYCRELRHTVIFPDFAIFIILFLF